MLYTHTYTHIEIDAEWRWHVRECARFFEVR